MKLNSFIIIEYVKTSIDILVDIKVKKQIESFFNNYNFKTENSNIEAYEDLLRKSEADIRNHIKIEHQMKIYSDNLKAKIEELEKSKAEYKINYLALQEVILFFFSPLINYLFLISNEIQNKFLLSLNSIICSILFQINTKNYCYYCICRFLLKNLSIRYFQMLLFVCFFLYNLLLL